MSEAPIWFVAAALWWLVALQYHEVSLAIVPCIYLAICCFMAIKRLAGD